MTKNNLKTPLAKLPGSCKANSKTIKFLSLLFLLTFYPLQLWAIREIDVSNPIHIPILIPMPIEISLPILNKQVQRYQ